MYRIFISDPKNSDFSSNVGLFPCEFYLTSADDVCKVMKELSSSKLLYTLQEISVSSVDDVLDHFLLIDKNKKIR